jgi:ketosteroid isomerase-like protein
MTTDECKQVVRDFLGAIAAHDLDHAKSMISDNATIWGAGSPFVKPGQYFGAIQALIDRSFGDWEMTIGSIIAEDNKVAVESEMRIQIKNGKLYNGQAHVHFEVTDGQITLIREYVDIAHFQETFDGRDPILGRPRRYSPFTGKRTM